MKTLHSIPSRWTRSIHWEISKWHLLCFVVRPENCLFKLKDYSLLFSTASFSPPALPQCAMREAPTCRSWGVGLLSVSHRMVLVLWKAVGFFICFLGSASLALKQQLRARLCAWAEEWHKRGLEAEQPLNKYRTGQSLLWSHLPWNPSQGRWRGGDPHSALYVWVWPQSCAEGRDGVRQRCRSPPSTLFSFPSPRRFLHSALFWAIWFWLSSAGAGLGGSAFQYGIIYR